MRDTNAHAVATSSSSARDRIVINKNPRSKSKTGRPLMPKVRTGCITCKIRRVKCDEGKPICNRCINFGVDCDGYADVQQQRPVQQTRLGPFRRVLPGCKETLKTKDTASLGRILHAGPRFEDEQEGRCYRIYLEETAARITGPFKNSLWERLIPQISEQEPFIRYAVAALGALSKLSKDARQKDRLYGGQHLPCYQSLDYTYALKQYDKALRGMRKAIATGEHDMRRALIACVLVFCFESLQGKLGSAIVQAESGLMLLHQWTIEKNSISQANSLVDSGRQHVNIDQEIMDAFSSLDQHVLFLLDRRPAYIHELSISNESAVILNMPAVFDTLLEARYFLASIMKRDYHFIILALNAAKSNELGGPWRDKKDTTWDGSANMSPGESVFSTCKVPRLELLQDCLDYREDIRNWSRATDVVFETVRQVGTEDERVMVALLQIHEIINDIMLAGVFFVEETAWDVFIPRFQFLLSLCQYVQPYLVASAEGSALFHFDLGIMIALFLLGLRCRDKATRDGGIELCLRASFREGTWDSIAVGHLINWIAQIEERGRDEVGYIPEHKRVFMTGCYMDLHDRRAVLGCTQRSLEGLIFREEIVTW